MRYAYIGKNMSQHVHFSEQMKVKISLYNTQKSAKEVLKQQVTLVQKL